MTTLTADAVSRLSPETHALAERAKRGEWGRALVDLPLSLDDVPGMAEASPPRRYAECVRLIAENAPLRIVPGERVVGAATLEKAAFHQVPVYAMRADGEAKPAYRSVSHVTLGFDHALEVGYRGLRRQVDDRLARGDLDDEGRELLEAMRAVLDAAATWHARYMARLEELIAESDGDLRRRCATIRDTLRNVPEHPPETFAEAVQALWLLFAFQRLCGNWPGIGRIDAMLGPFLERDLAAGRITIDDARELIAHFWIRGAEWTGANCFGGSGDAQHYQNIVLGGCDADGNDVANEVTYLVLDVVEELLISDFPVAVRIGPDTPGRLLRRIAEAQRRGGGIVAVYNDDVVLDALVRFGYPLREARRYANDGCWEVQIPGETLFSYKCVDCLAVLQRTLGVKGEAPAGDFDDFESLYAAFREGLRGEVDAVHDDSDAFGTAGPPSVTVDLLERDCIERARGYCRRGTRYVVRSPHAGGLADTGDSLLAIKRFVFDERRLALPELADILRNDWAGHESLRAEIRRDLVGYGNGDAAADAMVRRVYDDFVAFVEAVPERNGVLRPAGVSTFGRELAWRPDRGAGAHGHHDGDILATNFSPSPGAARNGPTGIVRSYCAMDLRRIPNGGALEIMLHPTAVAGESGLRAMVALLRAFVALGGFYMQVDAVSRATLLDAQAHPDRHRELAVRISGWSARFVTLSADWQQLIINRTE